MISVEEQVILGKRRAIEKKEEIARECREYPSQPAPWAFEHEGNWYCFLGNCKPPCAGEESRVLTRGLYSSETGKVKERALHYVCGEKNGR